MSYFSESSEKTLRFGDLNAMENAPLAQIRPAFPLSPFCRALQEGQQIVGALRMPSTRRNERTSMSQPCVQKKVWDSSAPTMSISVLLPEKSN